MVNSTTGGDDLPVDRHPATQEVDPIDGDRACLPLAQPEAERTDRLVGWAGAPGARWCHPREEHLLSLHVCYGAGGGPATQVFDDLVLGKRASGYAW